MSTFINAKPTFINGLRSLPKNLSDYIILDSWVYANYTLADELFSKDLQRIETCLSVNSKLWGKLVSLVPIMFDNNLRVMSVAFL